jgi:hypothetical protein
VRGPVKVIVWVLVFATCAALGAFVASRTDPFPPGVTDPGERPTTTASPSPSERPDPRRWQVSGNAGTEHVLHVGGSCRSDWDVQGVLREGRDGRLAGEGLATLRGPGGCDFPTADVQSETIPLAIVGVVDQDRGVALLRFAVDGALLPVGSKDLGGFVETMDGARIPAGTGRASRFRAPDGNEGVYAATWRLRIDCIAGC